MKFSKRRSYSSPIRYGFTRQSLALAGGTHAVALSHRRQLWHLSLADAADTGTVQDLHGYSALYQQYLATGDTFMENKFEHGTLFAYRQGFGVLFIDQVLLFDTPHQPEPRVLEVLNPDLSVRGMLTHASTVDGCPSAAVWVPATDQLAAVYEHRQFYGRGLFLAHLALCAGPASAAAYRLLAQPQTLTLGPALQEYISRPGFDNVLDAPQLLGLRQVAGEVQVATLGGHYSAQLAGAGHQLGLLALAPGTTAATHLAAPIPTRWAPVRLAADGTLASWNQYQPAAQAGLYFYTFATGEITRLGFRQKAFSESWPPAPGEQLRWLSFDREEAFIWVFSSAGATVFEAH
jgi:hypothetical protein